MLGNLRVMFFQKINDLKFCVLIRNEFKYFADEEIEDKFRVILLVCLNYAVLGEIYQFMSSEPVSSVPDTFDKLSD